MITPDENFLIAMGLLLLIAVLLGLLVYYVLEHRTLKRELRETRHEGIARLDRFETSLKAEREQVVRYRRWCFRLAGNQYNLKPIRWQASAPGGKLGQWIKVESDNPFKAMRLLEKELGLDDLIEPDEMKGVT